MWIVVGGISIVVLIICVTLIGIWAMAESRRREDENDGEEDEAWW